MTSDMHSALRAEPASQHDAPITIIDVIHNYTKYSKEPQIFVVISRRPKYVYKKEGNRLSAHDGGFYNFMYIEHAHYAKAFGGREFDIQLDDGTTLHCAGQVWHGGSSDVEPMISVGCGTIEELEKCYVFTSAEISKAKYDAWMAVNTPSFDYDKYNPRTTLAFLNDIQRRHPSDRAVSPKRARKLRQRGVTIRRHPETGAPGWSPHYEYRKAEIMARRSPEYRGRFYPGK